MTVTVHDLSELMTPAQDDEILIWDVSAGQAMKIKRSVLIGALLTGGGTVATGGFTLTVPATGTPALLALAQSFTAQQTFTSNTRVRPHEASNLWSIDASHGAGAVVPNTYVFQLSADHTFAGLVLIVNDTDGQAGLFLCAGGQVVEIADGGSVYSKTKDTGSSTNVYYDGGSQEYRIQNNTGASRTYHIFTVRIRATS